MRIRAGAGFTIVEMMLTIAVLGILLGIAVPNFTRWINNTKIRAGAEAISAGLNLARTEAVRRNASVAFTLTGQTGWQVGTVTTVETIQTRGANDGSAGMTVAVVPVGATTVTFDGLGRVIPNADATASLTSVTVNSPNISDARTLTVSVGSGGNVRMCDSGIPAPDPRAC